jgi:hypothetical protein
MVIAGLALTVVVLSSFAGLSDSAREDAAKESARSLGDLIEAFRNCGREGEVRIEAQSILVDDTRSLVVRNGSIWVRSGSSEGAVDGPLGIELLEHGQAVDELVVGWGDVLILRSSMSPNGRAGVQLEKVEATSSTASMNFLHSSSVL